VAVRATKVTYRRQKLLVSAGKRRVVEDEAVGTQNDLPAAKIEIHGTATVVAGAPEERKCRPAHLAVGSGEAPGARHEVRYVQRVGNR
jgi:hypothetical protein